MTETYTLFKLEKHTKMTTVKSLYKPGQAQRVSRSLKLLDLKTIGT